MIEIVLATNNESKALQIKEVFAGSNLKVLSQSEVGITGEAVEDGKTLEDNALKKAWFVYHKLPCNEKKLVMADDTGLFIRALKGLPGVKSARWAGEQATTDEITAYTLKQLEGQTDRRAIFSTVVALVSPSGGSFLFRGYVKGMLLELPRVKPQPKMPYSPLFKPDESDKVWAEMTTAEENAISHRGKAFRRAKAFLENQSLV